MNGIFVDTREHRTAHILNANIRGIDETLTLWEDRCNILIEWWLLTARSDKVPSISIWIAFSDIDPLLAPTPVSQWVSESVSDSFILEIASPSFASRIPIIFPMRETAMLPVSSMSMSSMSSMSMSSMSMSFMSMSSIKEEFPPAKQQRANCQAGLWSRMRLWLNWGQSRPLPCLHCPRSRLSHPSSRALPF